MQSTSIALHRSDEAKKSLSEKLSATQPSPAGQQEFLGYKSLFSFLWSSFTYLENEILLLAKLRPICECPSIFNNAYHKDPWFFWQLHMHEPNFPEFLWFGSVGNFDDELLVSKSVEKWLLCCHTCLLVHEVLHLWETRYISCKIEDIVRISLSTQLYKKKGRGADAPYIRQVSWFSVGDRISCAICFRVHTHMAERPARLTVCSPNNKLMLRHIIAWCRVMLGHCTSAHCYV